MREPNSTNIAISNAEDKGEPRRYGRRAVLIFLALVMHFHGVYGILAVINDYILPVVVAVVAAIGSIIILTAENTLGNILAFEMDKSDEMVRQGFCCGLFDNDLKYCLGYPCSAKLWFSRRIYFVRLFYYNMNGFLIAAAWFGIDVNRALITERVVGGDITGRVFMDLLYLLLANIVLVSFHEMLGQFGVVGDKAVVQYPNEPEIQTMKIDAEPDSPKVDGGLEMKPTLQSKLLNEGPSERPHMVSRVESRKRANISLREDIITRGKIIVTFIALTMFWTSTWDLFCSIPSEALVGDEGDDDVDDDYYDVHVKGQTDDEFKLFLLGIAYTLVSMVYMIITGELFSVVKRQDETSEKVLNLAIQCMCN